MLPAQVLKSWRDDRRAIIGWAAGIGAFVSIYVGFYSQFQGAADLKQNALPKEMQDFLGIADMTSPIGYLEATVFSLMGPLLVIMSAITLAARTIPRPEEDGGMELLLANPLSRTAFATQRLTAAALAATGVVVVTWLLLLIITPAVGMDITTGNLTAAIAGLLGLAWCFLGISFLIGAISGSRGQVLAIAGGLAVATYLARALSNISEGAAWLKWLSPFHYFIGSDPLRTGFHFGYLGVLVAVAVITSIVGVLVFDRRDVGV